MKECTVVIDVEDNKRFSPMSIIESVEIVCGDGNVLAVVPRSGNLYEITVVDNDAVRALTSEPLDIGRKRVECKPVVSQEKVVSFLHLPAFITDEVITDKLENLGIELKSSIKRRVYEGTTVADGTRYVVAKFPPNLSSLPYTMKFEIDENRSEYIRVKHDNQAKVCTKCFSDEHLYASCPLNQCFRCKEYGHLLRHCENDPCVTCNEYPARCLCYSDRGRDDNVDEAEQNARNTRESDDKQSDNNNQNQENHDNTAEYVSAHAQDTCDNRRPEKANSADKDMASSAKRMKTDSCDNTSQKEVTKSNESTEDEMFDCNDGTQKEVMEIHVDTCSNKKLDANNNSKKQSDDVLDWKVESGKGDERTQGDCGMSSGGDDTLSVVSTPENWSEVDLNDVEMAETLGQRRLRRKSKNRVRGTGPYVKKNQVVNNNSQNK